MIGLVEALAIHDVLLKASGGTSGLRDQAGLDAAINRPYMTFGGNELYPEPVDKAAAILESVIKNHPFIDGNKRAGYALARLTLNNFHLDLKAPDDDEYELLNAVAMAQLDADGIRAWLAPRIVAF